jgi:hypothetical protein
MVTAYIAAAMICFSNQCYHALVGRDTPVGDYQLKLMTTEAAGYGGDILAFHETDDYVWAIHRVYLRNPKQHRLQRILSDDPITRHITMGCINVMPDVYQKLVDCCRDSALRIAP